MPCLHVPKGGQGDRKGFDEDTVGYPLKERLRVPPQLFAGAPPKVSVVIPCYNYRRFSPAVLHCPVPARSRRAGQFGQGSAGWVIAAAPAPMSSRRPRW
jgi:hypothetical protein